LDLLKKKF